MALTMNVTFTPMNNGTAFSVPVTSASFEETNAVNIGSQSSGAGAGKVVFQPLILTRMVDVHSPVFLTYIASGTAFAEVKVEYAQSAPMGQPKPFYAATFKLVALSRLNQTSASDGVQETLELHYGALQMSYTGPDSKGTVLDKPITSQWNVVKNTATFDA